MSAVKRRTENKKNCRKTLTNVSEVSNEEKREMLKIKQASGSLQECRALNIFNMNVLKTEMDPSALLPYTRAGPVTN